MKSKFNSLKLRLILFIILCCIPLYIISCGNKDKKVVIGAVFPMTGPAEFAGEEVRDGINMAVDELNHLGGINGAKIRIIIVNGNDPHVPVETAYENLMKNDPVLVLSCTSYYASKLKPSAEKNKRLLISLVAAAPDITRNSEWVYRYWPTAEHEAPPMAKLFEKLGAEKAGVIYLDDPYGLSVFKDLKERFSAGGIEITAASFPLKNTDFEKQAKAVMDTGAVVIVGFDAHIIKILKTLRRMNYKGYIISTTSANLPTVRKLPESNGVYVTAPAFYNDNFSFINEIKEHYEERYHKPLTQYSANSYDFMYMLSGLLEDKPVNRETIKRVLDLGFLYSGVFGNVELKKGSKDIFFPLYPARIINGKMHFE